MAIGFYGVMYAKSDTASSDAGRRFETTEKKLKRCIVAITTQGQNFGSVSVYSVYYAAGSKFDMVDIDVSTLYFANATAGQNGTVSIMGTLAEG